MRKTCHICLSSHNEVMFRDEADLNRGFNALAVAVLETDSRLLCESFTTTHYHGLLQTDCPEEVIYRTRYAHARYFNSRHERKGRLGEKRAFILHIEGFHHTMAALNYVSRQGLHHGLSASAFGYEHCSVRAFFQNELGRHSPELLMPDGQRYKYLPQDKTVPTSYRMNASGLLLREDIVDTAQVEAIYATARNFLYQMNRIGDEFNLKEQKEESSPTPLITMAVMEPSYSGEQISQLIQNQSGRYNPTYISDLELCRLIDGACIPKYFKEKTLYGLSVSQREWLCNLLWKNLWPRLHKRTSAAQLKRCLWL